MTNTIAIFGLLVVLMAIGMPVGVALGLTVLSFMFIFTDVPLESVADIRLGSGPAQIDRLDGVELEHPLAQRVQIDVKA